MLLICSLWCQVKGTIKGHDDTEEPIAWQDVTHCPNLGEICYALEHGANIYLTEVTQVSPLDVDSGHVVLKVAATIHGSKKDKLKLAFNGQWSIANPHFSIFGWPEEHAPAKGDRLVCVVLPNGYDGSVEVPEGAQQRPKQFNQHLDALDIEILAAAGIPATQPVEDPYWNWVKAHTIKVRHLREWDGAACPATLINSSNSTVIAEYYEVARLFALQHTDGEKREIADAVAHDLGIAKAYAQQRKIEMESAYDGKGFSTIEIQMHTDAAKGQHHIREDKH